MTTRSRRGIGAAAALLATGSTVVALSAAPAAATPSAGVVLNEVYGGGGNSGATYKNDFIELSNRGSGAQSLAGWSVQYLPGTPSGTSTWNVTALQGSIAAGDRYLVGEAGSTGGTTDLPPTQATGTTNLSGSSGTVALVNGTDPLTCKTAADCAADPHIVDLVGYGTAVVREGAPAPAAAGNTASVSRKSSPDTDDNSADFVSADASPGAVNPIDDGGGERRSRSTAYPRHPRRYLAVAARRRAGDERPRHRHRGARLGVKQGLLVPGPEPRQ